MVTAELTVEKIWTILREIPDPEIPVLSLVDLNVVKRVDVSATDGVRVELRPTFSGCPAIDLMKRQIHDVLTSRGVEHVSVEVDLASPWSTDDMGEEAKERLRAFGIAPPPRKGRDIGAALRLPVPCPHCGSEGTHLDSAFGSTLCKQLFVCDACHQPFERFKPL